MFQRKISIIERFWEKLSWVTASIFVIFSWGITYFSGAIGGKFDFSILAGEMFGITKLEKLNNIEPLYHGENQTGWDGQFYYRIANDLLGNSDASAHIDNPPYRYQRIGLPAMAKLFSIILNFNYVPVVIFIGTSILLWLLMLQGLRLMQDSRLITSRLDLFLLATWCGIPLTMFTGLTDSAADSLGVLAIGIYFTNNPFFKKYKYKLAISVAAMAALTKESAIVYLLALLFIRIFQMRSVDSITKSKSIFLGVYSLLPILFWQLYIKYKFGIWGFEAGSAISQKVPFGSYLSEMQKSARLMLTGDFNQTNLTQFLGILIYSALLVNALVFLFSCLKNLNMHRKSIDSYQLERSNHNKVVQYKEVQLFKLIFVILVLIVQSSMGVGVLFNWTGYLKNAFPLVLIFCISESLKSFSVFEFNLLTRRDIRILIIIASLLCFRWFYVPLPHYANLGIYPKSTFEKFTVATQQPCRKVEGELTVIKTKEVQPFLRNLTFRERLYQINIALKNISTVDWILSQDPGAYKVGYQWFDENGLVIRDGQRAILPSPLKANETREMMLYITVPRGLVKNVQLSISLMQEGCYWSWREQGNFKVSQELTIRELTALSEDHLSP